jgi:hypothetical protein
VKVPMDDTEFTQLLEAYTFGDMSKDERQKLAVAVLESPERARDFARAEEIREQLRDPRFFQEVFNILDEPTDLRDERAELQKQRTPRPGLLWYAGGAAAAAALVAAVYIAFDRNAPVDVATSVPLSVPNAVASGTTEPAAGADAARPLPEFVAFQRPSREAAYVIAALPNGNGYAAGDQVGVEVTVRDAARVYAIVRGPAGLIRSVYPTSPSGDRVLQPGLRRFSFAASDPLDPRAGGTFTLRVFEVLAPIPAPAQVDWAWVAMNGEFAEKTYTVTPSR